MKTGSWHFLSGSVNLVGFVVMALCANFWSNHLQQLHENDMWFSNIKEVEREISFRTEQGFYYSYYKQLIKATSLPQGFQDLCQDNATEHGHTINVWKRFNLYQELVLATIHKLVSFNMEPIMFYVEVVFSLQGFHAAMLFLLSWQLSGTWLSGVLSICLMLVHRSEITRVSYTVPLREHFSLPFFYAMIVSISRFLNFGSSQKKAKQNFWATKEFHLVQIYVMTFLFVITWQFAQFAILLHSLMCFALATSGLLNKDRVSNVLSVHFCAILCVWYCQFYQPMVINSLAVSFIPQAILSLQSQMDEPAKLRQNGVLRNVGRVAVRIGLVLIATLALNTMMKTLLGQADDNHIFQFVASWLGFQDETDFDTRLYRCLAAFKPLGWAMYEKLASNGALLVYFLYLAAQLVFMFLTLCRQWYVKEKNEEQNGHQKKTEKNTNWFTDWLEKLHSDVNLNFIVTMDQSPALVYNFGKLFQERCC